MQVDLDRNFLRGRAKATPLNPIRSLLIGRPLATADAPHQTIGKVVGLAVFASDALSSTAYSTQEMLVVLAAAGAAGLLYITPLTLGIIVLLGILTLSYEQTIHAYPDGGGAYIVARDNLGELSAQVAGAALLTDYILTVAVSISSGVANFVSAVPVLYPYRVLIAITFVLLVMQINLRGVKEAGIIFAFPTYFFVVMMYLTIGVGMFRLLTGTLGTVIDPPEIEMLHGLQGVTAFLILRAFANGTTALTGVEAISNGITAFKEPRSKNAGKTLVWMSVILGSLLLGTAFLAYSIGAVPSQFETVFSQLVRTVFNSRGVIYLAALSATTVILIMAANTAFADFPRLGALVAGDGFLPRQLNYRGDRLVYSRGIVALALIASALIIFFQASVTNLIPLYAIGVFLSFTLSQTGMARRWWKSGHAREGEVVQEAGSTYRYDRHWIAKMIINGLGAICTAVVMIVFAVTKFKDGAWVVIILTPLLVGTFQSIHRHYKNLASQLSLEKLPQQKRIRRNRVIMPINGVHQGTLRALQFARTLSTDITVVHISIDPLETGKVEKKWEKWGEGYRLLILDSPYRLFIEPLVEYLSKVEESLQQGDIITIVIPQFVPQRRWTGVLHARTSELLRKVLLNREEIVIVEVPYITHG
ncbi:MAG: APC family permease [Anaerolineaceae bacterium]|nr:APC family permease [Anaerolineaceae bacterium]